MSGNSPKAGLDMSRVTKKRGLSMLERVEVLERLDNGETQAAVARSLGVHTGVIGNIKRSKTEILNLTSNAETMGDLLQTRRPVNHRRNVTRLTVRQKVDAINQMEVGVPLDDISVDFGISPWQTKQLQTLKPDILEYASSAKSIDLEKTRRRSATAPKVPKRLSLLQQSQVLDRLNNGEQQCDIAKDFGVEPCTVLKIKQRRDRILEFVSSTDDASALEATRLPPSRASRDRRAPLSIGKKFDAIQRLVDGEALTDVAKSLGISAGHLHGINANKDRILDFVSGAESIADLDEVKLPPKKSAKTRKPPTRLSILQKAKVVERVENGDRHQDIARDFNISLAQVSVIKKDKDDIVKAAEETVADALANGGSAPPLDESKPPAVLSLGDKVQMLERLDAGDSVNEICRSFGAKRNQVYNVRMQRVKILEYAGSATAMEALERTKIPRKTPIRLTVFQKVEILQRIDSGESQVGIANAFKISQAQVTAIKKARNSILAEAGDMNTNDAAGVGLSTEDHPNQPLISRGSAAVGSVRLTRKKVPMLPPQFAEDGRSCVV